MNSATATKHVFEHLAPGPYKVVGFDRRTYQACPGAPVQVGGSCDHCGTGIIDTFVIQGSNGHRFKVGSSCVLKAGDRGLKKQIDPILAKLRREKAEDLDRRKKADIKAWLADETLRASLKAEGHPNEYRAKAGDTRLDWVEFMLRRSGRTGRAKLHKFLKSRKGAN